MNLDNMIIIHQVHQIRYVETRAAAVQSATIPLGERDFLPHKPEASGKATTAEWIMVLPP